MKIPRIVCDSMGLRTYDPVRLSFLLLGSILWMRRERERERERGIQRDKGKRNTRERIEGTHRGDTQLRRISGNVTSERDHPPGNSGRAQRLFLDGEKLLIAF